MKERKENKEKIKEQISILDLANEFFGVEKHGSLYRIKEHDSCILYPQSNTWHRYSRNSGGDVIDFLGEFEECGNLSFNEAYKKLLGRIDPEKVLTEKEVKVRNDVRNTLAFKQNCCRSLKEQMNIDDNNRNVLAYLIKERKIDPSIVYEMINKKQIYQLTNEFGSKNVAFCGYNEDGMLASVCIRACNSKQTFKGDLKNCDYNYGWFYSPDIKPFDFCPKIKADKPLLCFESFIDMMSFQTLMKSNGENIYDYNYLSCGSVQKANLVLKYQERYNIKSIILAFDNDEAGLLAMDKLTNQLKNRGCNIEKKISKENDWNNDLKKSSMGKGLTDRISTAKNCTKYNLNKKEVKAKSLERV